MTTGIDRDRTALRSMLDAWTEALRSKDAEGVVRTALSALGADVVAAAGRRA